MGIQRIEAFETTDGKIFTSERKANAHQNSLAHEAIDNVMYSYGKLNPGVHYPNLSMSLIPFMKDNAKEIIKALQIAL